MSEPTKEANPDKEKMKDYAIRLARVQVPAMETAEGKTALKNVSESLDAVLKDMIFWSEDNYHNG